MSMFHVEPSFILDVPIEAAISIREAQVHEALGVFGLGIVLNREQLILMLSERMPRGFQLPILDHPQFLRFASVHFLFETVCAST